MLFHSIHSCASGYAKSSDSDECEDINECDTGEANCHATNQACLNTIGSFKCLDILVSERTSNCEEGFRYQARIDQCVGRVWFSLFILQSSLRFDLFATYFFCFYFHLQNELISADINECLEGTDDCNRKTQLCLNLRGSYKCQDKIGDKCLTGLKYNSETKLCEGACFVQFTLGLDWISAFTTIHFTNKISIISYQTDINECQLDPDSCDDGYKCINTIGSFECIILRKQKYEKIFSLVPSCKLLPSSVNTRN